jgi:hypothetical protein
MFTIRMFVASWVGLVAMFAAVVGDRVRGCRPSWLRSGLAIPFDLLVLMFVLPAMWLCPVPGLVELALVRVRVEAKASTLSTLTQADLN